MTRKTATSKTMTLKAITANRLDDGLVVYLTPEGGWSERLSEARLARDDDAAAALEAEGGRAEAAQAVVAPYAIDLLREGGVLRPARYREIIRADGPSVETRGTF